MKHGWSKQTIKWASLAVLFAVAAGGITGCGGGGGGSPAPAPIATPPSPPATPPVTPPPPPTDPLAPQTSVTGDSATATFDVAAIDVGGTGGDSGSGGDAGDGAPIKRARVIVTDRNGQERVGQTNDNGSYFIRFPSTFQAPIVTRVITPGGVVFTSASGEAPAPNKVLRINVNPLTDKIVSDSLPAAVRGTDKSFNGADVDAARLTTATNDLVSSVRAALGSAGVSGVSGAATQFDPVKSVYKYDGTGVDAVLESLTHTRNPNTGATELRAKLQGIRVDTSGLPIPPALVTSASPLATAQVALPTSPALTFAKVSAWIAQMNACLAADPQSPPAICDDVSGRQFIARDYLNDSRDWREDMAALYSNPGRRHVQGSTFRNPVVLGIGRFSGSTQDDMVLVEVVVRQPRTGPLAAQVASDVEYPKLLVFRRDDTLQQAVAGNWILQGNMQRYLAAVSTNVVRVEQTNPNMQQDPSGRNQSRVEVQLGLFFGRARYDPASGNYVDSGVRAVRVRGPGLPGAGVVLVPPNVPRLSWMVVHNKQGSVPLQSTFTAASGNAMALAWSSPTGQSLTQSWPAQRADYLDAPISDFSGLAGFAEYTFEIFNVLTLNPAVPNQVITVRNNSAVLAPGSMASLPLQDFSASRALVTAPAASIPASSTAGVRLQWSINALATPIAQVRVTGGTALGRIEEEAPVFNDVIVGARLTSSFVLTPDGLPALRQNVPGDFRAVSLFSRPGRVSFEQRLEWSNPSLLQSPSFAIQASNRTPSVGQTVLFSISGGTSVSFSNGVTLPTSTEWFVNGAFEASGQSYTRWFTASGPHNVVARLTTASGLSFTQSFALTASGVISPMRLVQGISPASFAPPGTTQSYTASVDAAVPSNTVIVLQRATYSSVAARHTSTYTLLSPRWSNAQAFEFSVGYDRLASFMVAFACPNLPLQGLFSVEGIASESCVSLGTIGNNGASLGEVTLSKATSDATSVTRGSQNLVGFEFTGDFSFSIAAEVASSAGGPFASASSAFSLVQYSLPAQTRVGTILYAFTPSANTPSGTLWFRLCDSATTPKNCTNAVGPVFSVGP